MRKCLLSKGTVTINDVAENESDSDAERTSSPQLPLYFLVVLRVAGHSE